MSAPADPFPGSDLLKRATSLRKEGDVESAIHCLRQAYTVSAAARFEHTVDTYLRLPMYLQEAGRSDEAWQEFNALLAWYMRDPLMWPMHHARVYDKMRLFLQREGRRADAVTMGVLSHLAWLRGLCAQQRIAEFQDASSPQAVEAVVRPLLVKAGLGAACDSLVRLVIEEAQRAGHIDLAGASTRTAAMVDEAARA